MEFRTLKDVYSSLLKNIEEYLDEHEFKNESDRHIAGFLLDEIRDNSQEITKSIEKLTNVLR